MKNIDLDIDMLISASELIPEVLEIMTDKKYFKGFKGRFSSNYYGLYAAIRLNFKPEDENSIWVALGEGWKDSDDYIYVYDYNKNEILEKILSKELFEYRQKPTKQDGLNEKRKERFVEMNGDLNFELSYPQSANDVRLFLSELQNLALMKVKADNLDDQILENQLLNKIQHDLDIAEKEYEEGGRTKRLVNYYERNSNLRLKAIRLHGLDCLICGFNFKQVYGDLGDNFIEVHHIVPISTKTIKQKVDPQQDLVCVCANCHRMLHRNEEEIDIGELKKIVESKKIAAPNN